MPEGYLADHAAQSLICFLDTRIKTRQNVKNKIF